MIEIKEKFKKVNFHYTFLKYNTDFFHWIQPDLYLKKRFGFGESLTFTKLNVVLEI